MNTLETRRWRRLYLGLALTASATLLLELALTRIYSVVLFYHFAFLAISVALFGLGVGGVVSYYLAGRGREVWPLLGTVSALNAPVTLALLAGILELNVRIRVTPETALKLAVAYFGSAVPFFSAGLVIATAMSAGLERVNRVYFFDLAGAAAGCILLVPILNILGGPNTVMAAAVLYAVAGAVWYSMARHRAASRIAAALAGLLVACLAWNQRARWIDIRYAKGVEIRGELFTKWNSFSRIGVKPDDGAGRPAIVIDGDAATSIPDFASDAPLRLREELLRSGPGLPYRIRPGATTLIIGPGGGYDVARALASGSQSVTGVEINPIIIHDVMRNRFAEASRRLYFRPEVQIHVEDGRTFVRRPGPRYQVIQMTLVDTWASTAAGAFALSENNLYTVEAFVDYFNRLADDGLLSITRWEFEPPRESLRVVSLAREALTRLGAPDPARHFVIAREGASDVTGYGAKDTVVVKKTPFTDQELSVARQAMAEAGIPAVYLPNEKIDNPFTDFLLARDPASFAQQYRFDISPVSDNRPFFFYTVPARDLWSFVTLRRSEDVKINLGVIMLFVSVAVSVVATALMMLLPRSLLGTQVPTEPSALLHLLYFFAVGVGFIMVEIGLIQKLVLFLGNPTYSLTVVVFSLLISSGLGSYASGKLIGDDDQRLAVSLGLVMVTVALLAGVVPRVVDAGVGLPIAARCALSAALLFPAGFLMGMPFPSGLKRLGRFHPTAVRWAWAVNSASSVLGSVVAIFFAIHWGLLQTLLLGAAAYGLALVSLKLTAIFAPCLPEPGPLE
jgi:hypothetical protein